MPTLTSGINLALQSMLAHSQALEVTQHNIANANTPGYRRQSAVLTTGPAVSVYSPDQGLYAGLRGTGVMVESIQRFNVSFFDERYRGAVADSGAWEMQSKALSQLEAAMSDLALTGLSARLDRFWTSWQNLASNPSNSSLRIGLMSEARGLAMAFQQQASQIDGLQSDLNQSVISRVEEINKAAKQIAHLNSEISRITSIGQQPNDLLDQRDSVLDRLAEISGAVSFPQKNGEVSVSINGHILVTGHDSFALKAVPVAANRNMVDVQWEDGRECVVASGELSGILIARDETLANQKTQLDALAGKLIEVVNTAHMDGYDLNGEAGIEFFTGTDASTIEVNTLLSSDKIAAAGAAGAPGDNTAAQKIAGLKDALVMSSDTETLGSFYRSQLAGAGTLAKEAGDVAGRMAGIVNALDDQRESAGGVNLDEEAANLVKYQRAYQAAARTMTMFDEMLDQLINRTGLVGR